MKNSKFMKATAMLFTMILLIGSTFAENIDPDHEGDNGGGVSFLKYNGDWDDPTASVYAYLYMDVLDDDGNDAAYLSVTINRSDYGAWVWPGRGNQIDAVEYSASACVYTAGWQGRANAWVQVPRSIHDQEGNNRDQQKMNIGGPGQPSSVYASISCKRSKDGINDNGNRKVTASARVWQGGISANIKLHISEF